MTVLPHGSKCVASWGTTTKESGDAPELKGARWFSWADLKKATNDFSEDNEIGAGGYGKVGRLIQICSALPPLRSVLCNLL